MTRVVDLVRAVVAPLTRTRLFRRFAPIVLPPVERLVAALSGGRVQLSALLVPSLILRTRGARSGEPRDAPLMYTLGRLRPRDRRRHELRRGPASGLDG